MTIVDYRWGGTAEGWAYHAANNEKMAQWLATAEREQGAEMKEVRVGQRQAALAIASIGLVRA